VTTPRPASPDPLPLRASYTPGLPDVFHFTHERNLAAIVRLGELRCHRTAPCEEDIADVEIKGHRARKPVPLNPRGVVADYVPFYFATRSPMLYRLVRQGLDQGEVVYLRTSTERLLTTERPVVVTDGNAASHITRFHPPERLLEVVDWEIMSARIWADTDEDGDRKRRRQAELLVHEHLPLEVIEEIGVLDEDGADRVLALLDGRRAIAVNVRTGWYFHEYR
jgi:hypothetical protein